MTIKERLFSWLSFARRHWLWTGAVLIVLILLIWKMWPMTKTSADVTTVKHGDIVQTISVTGKTESKSNVSLSFQLSGVVREVRANVGDRVERGQTLVVLNNDDLYASYLQAKAVADAQESKLKDMQAGPTSSGSAQVAANGALSGLSVAISDADTKIQDAVLNHIDKLFNGPHSGSPVLSYSISVSNVPIELNTSLVPQDLKSTVSNERVKLESWMKNFQPENVAGLTSSGAPAMAEVALDRLRQVKALADDLTKALSYVSVGSPDQNYASLVNGVVSDISTTRNNLDASISSVNNALQNYNSTQANLNSPLVGAQKATVDQAKAGVLAAQAQLNKSMIVAPISGLVTKQDAKVGQTEVAGTPLVSIIAPEQLEIEVNVSEIDIGKIMVNNPVRITLDAFPNETFPGKVFYMDPAETIVDGVVNYKIKVAFDKADPRFKSGLTANLDIITQTKQNVLTIPQYAVIENDQGTFVNKIVSGKIVSTKIVTGLKDQNGNVEVVSGLKEGDQVQNVGMKTSS